MIPLHRGGVGTVAMGRWLYSSTAVTQFVTEESYSGRMTVLKYKNANIVKTDNITVSFELLGSVGLVGNVSMPGGKKRKLLMKLNIMSEHL